MESMAYSFSAGMIKTEDISKDEKFFLLCDREYFSTYMIALIQGKRAADFLQKNIGEGMRSDIICENNSIFARINLPERKRNINNNSVFFFFVSRKFFAIIFDKKEGKGFSEIESTVETLLKRDYSSKTFAFLIYGFWETLLGDDARLLEKNEMEIADFEAQIEDESKNLSFAALLRMRRKLFILKGFYAQLNEIAACLNNPVNGIFSNEETLVFQPLVAHTKRLEDNVLALRENLTQIRQEYNSVMDYNLNKVMKFHTVLTTLFLPLNFIAGWYGMNFDIPEFGFAWAYPLLAFLCISLLCGMIIFLKKKKLF